MSDVVVENEFLTGNVASNLESRVILYDMQLFEQQPIMDSNHFIRNGFSENPSAFCIIASRTTFV